MRDKKGEAIWAWQLYLLGEGRTRLITLLWMRDAWASPMIIYCLLQDVADNIMMRKCKLGTKERAEDEQGRGFRNLEALRQA